MSTQITADQEITNTEDIIDVRDVIARWEYLETADDVDKDPGSEDQQELGLLTTLLDNLKSNGGDEEWRGEWYPITLIRGTYFEEYAQEFAEDTEAISNKAQWPYNCIDWDEAVRLLQIDYAYIDFDGVKYWAR